MWGGIKCSASCHTVVENIILSDKKIVSSYVPVLGPVMPVTILMSDTLTGFCLSKLVKLFKPLHESFTD